MATPPISKWSTTAANNTSALLGSPEGISGTNNNNVVDDVIRTHMADIATQLRIAEWFDWYMVPTFISTTSFSVPGDQSTVLLVDRRLQLVDATTLYGSVVSAVYNGSTLTTVTVLLDSGALSNSLVNFYIGIVTPINTSIPLTIAGGQFQSQTYTATYVSANVFTITGNQTSLFTAARRLKLNDSSTLYATIVSSSFSSVTTVNIMLDSGSASASLATVQLANLTSTATVSIPGTVASEWYLYPYPATRTGNTTFTVPTDVTSVFVAGRRMKCNDSSTLYGYVVSSAFSSVTTVTMMMDSGNLSASLGSVAPAILMPTNVTLPANTISEWQLYGYKATQTAATTCTIVGDVTAIFTVGRRVKCADSSTLYGSIITSSYSAPNTTLTISLDSGSLSASLTNVTYSLLSPTNISIPKAYKLPTTSIITTTSTFSVPGGVTELIVEGWGAGGGGGGNTVSGSFGLGGGGGGAGGYFYERLSGLTAGQTVSVTIGAGGAGGGTTANGSAGASTSFGAFCSATGGAGGGTGADANNSGFGGAGGIGSGGDLNFRGSAGNASPQRTAWITGAALGGMSPRGAGTLINGTITPGKGGTPGAGGSGAPGSFTTAIAGGDGGDGMVIVYY